MESCPQPQVEEATLGVTRLSDGRWQFLVWAPGVEKLQLRLIGPREQVLSLQSDGCGYHTRAVEDLEPGREYRYRFPDGRELPDPASRYQPAGVHGPSALVDSSAFAWTDHDWAGKPLSEYIIYELHVGTYSTEGTFEAAIARLVELAELGITAIEIMPVAQFPGTRNWGYDGVYPFAVQDSYGGPAGLQKLVNAAHERGLAVVLDVVYNHLGPEGNCLGEYAPYFTDRYRTPWGPAINFDGAYSDDVRRFFIENALYWLGVFRIDALRLDAIHGIVDASAVPFLADLGAAVQDLARRTGRYIYLMAESDLNDSRVMRARDQGGYGMDAQWSDDFHHSVHVLLTGENSGYYADFDGVLSLAETLESGWFYSGQFSRYRRRRHGNSSRGFSRDRFVVCSQNHDQVGNRALSDRLNRIVGFEKLKLAAGAVLLSPFLPLLFMGEEYAETAPFQYFTSHSDPDVIEAVRRGRRDEFAAFNWSSEPPEPQAESTFLRSKLNHDLEGQEPHRTMRCFYGELIALRRRLDLESLKVSVNAFAPRKALALRYEQASGRALLVFNFEDADHELDAVCEPGRWHKALDSADSRWGGPGAVLPQTIESSGTLRVRMPAASFAVFTSDAGSEE